MPGHRLGICDHSKGHRADKGRCRGVLQAERADRDMLMKKHQMEETQARLNEIYRYILIAILLIMGKAMFVKMYLVIERKIN